LPDVAAAGRGESAPHRAPSRASAEESAPGGGFRIFYEARLPDERHELRAELLG
jgi:hypothetical protein